MEDLVYFDYALMNGLLVYFELNIFTIQGYQLPYIVLTIHFVSLAEYWSEVVHKSWCRLKSIAMYLSFRRRLYRSKCHLILDFDVFCILYTRNNSVKERRRWRSVETWVPLHEHFASMLTWKQFRTFDLFFFSSMNHMSKVMVKLLYLHRWASVPVFPGPPWLTPRYPQPCRLACTSRENQPQSLARWYLPKSSTPDDRMPGPLQAIFLGKLRGRVTEWRLLRKHLRNRNRGRQRCHCVGVHKKNDRWIYNVFHSEVIWREKCPIKRKTPEIDQIPTVLIFGWYKQISKATRQKQLCQPRTHPSWELFGITTRFEA